MGEDFPEKRGWLQEEEVGHGVWRKVALKGLPGVKQKETMQDLQALL